MSDANNKSKRIPTECKICSAPALYSYVGVVVCSSCKMFFKRNADAKQKTLRCLHNGQCSISFETRHRCSACRLAKCFAFGMQVELFRSHINKTKQRKTVRKIVQLLRTDRSSLTLDQWNLLSNLISCFDEYSQFNFIDRMISEQNKLPLKMRFKMSILVNFLDEIFAGVQRLFEMNISYHSLTSIDRSRLYRKVIRQLVAFTSCFIINRSKLIDHIAFDQTIERLYGSFLLKNIRLVMFYVDQDIVQIKLILALLLFSTFDSINDDHSSLIVLQDSSAVFRIQNRYVDLTWRYLLYKYDFQQAVRCFSNLIRSFFALHRSMMNIEENCSNTELITRLIQRTEDSLDIPH